MKIKRFLVTLSPLAAAVCFCIVYIVCGRIGRNSLPGISADSQVAGIVAPASENNGIAYDITAFERDGAFVLFLPTRTDTEAVIFYAVDSEGGYLQRFTADFTSGGTYIGENIPVMAMKSPLPSLEVSFDCGKGSLEDIESSKDHSVWSYGDMVLTCSDEMAKQRGWEPVTATRDGSRRTPGSLAMRGHGNITWELYKRAYNLKLDNPIELLGMKEARDWVLLANADDYSLLRNEVFFDLAKKLDMPYEPSLEAIDLFIDGDYRGTYYLATRVEIGPTRVDIVRDHDFLYRWGIESDKSFKIASDSFRDEFTCSVEMIDNLDPLKTDSALDIAQHFITEIENASQDDPLADVDLEGFAKYYWIQEFSKNTDSTSRSFYTIWNADEGVMEIGPVWDMDRTAGVVEPFERGPDYLYPTEWAVREEEWFVPLFKNKAFTEQVRRVYEEEGLYDVFTQCIDEIPERIEYIRTSAGMNYIRWDVLGVEQNNHIVKWMGESTFDTQTQWLHEWLLQRRDWIEEAMTSGQE